ncbi:MAG: PepSY domain-containing protein [Gemmatimonadetes bacterium]|nr:PepSY domain-containing protein [Gemmatimonadota bacterium]
MARSYRHPIRQFLLFTHRWMGIPAALFLAAMGASGAILVYERPVDRLLVPRLHVVRLGTTRLPLDSLVAIADRAAPRPVKAGWLLLPQRPDEAARVQYRFRHVFIDPYRGTVLGERGMGESVVNQLRNFHQTFFLKRVGRFIALVCTGAGILLALGGVILWWPRKIVRFRARTSWRRINYDLHNVTGLLGLVGILLFGGTALMMASGDVLDPLYRRTFGDAPNPQLLPGSPRSGEPASLDAIARAADAAVPGPMREIVIPADPHGTYRVQKQAPGEYGYRARNIVFVDGNDARVRGVIDQNRRPMGTRVQMLTEDWHVAAFAPQWSLILGVVSCLLLAFTSLTGPLIWWKPRRKAPRSPSGSAAPATPPSGAESP